MVLLTSLFFQFNIGCMLVYIYIYIYKTKNPIKSSLDFALIVFWFLVVGQFALTTYSALQKPDTQTKTTKHMVSIFFTNPQI